MSESVPVRCPACRRERLYAVPAWPCACGTTVTPVLDGAAPPAVVVHRAWAEEWITLRCPRCARPAQWPRPELGCPCRTGSPAPGGATAVSYTHPTPPTIHSPQIFAVPRPF
ncbi:hypothetical protein [Streptomyces galbus]|uniref:Uncharacterized protein n=1 Tax=Streptomyces galbus TaxID=33898 RepID=A0ABX1ITV4_STRGB|nr:hypothetical protein [Streptomyces galbus]NKQ29059.1 hypothetical protein [Streptomyces galbus]